MKNNEQIKELAGKILFIFETPKLMFDFLGLTPEKIAEFELEVNIFFVTKRT